MCITEINGISLYKPEIFSPFKLTAGFTTRKGGVSTGEYESLSLSPMRGDDLKNVKENEKILADALNLDINRLTSTRQEHTDNIKIIGKEDAGMGIHRPWNEGVDGCITMEKNLPLICYSADCVPVLMYASDIEAIAAVHSGWRGTKDEISAKAVKKLVLLGAKPENIYVAIGPCIGKCCYEVSEEVAVHFNDVAPEASADTCEYLYNKGNGKYMLDLAFVNRLMLEKNNIPAENISLSGICTKCNNNLFFSHRGQNGKSGTLGGIICML